MRSPSKAVGWFALTGVVCLAVGAFLGAYFMGQYQLMFGTAADRLVGKLRIDAMLLRSAQDEGLTLERSPTAQSLVREADITTTALGSVAGDARLPESLPEAVKLLKELDANPLVMADAGSPRGAAAKVARSCLVAEFEKPKPNYRLCALNVGKAYKDSVAPLAAR